MRRKITPSRGGFTLVELAVVLLVIGLIVAFILTVSFSGIEQARLRATQSLITKLEVGLNDRINALLSVQANPNGTHRYLASIFPPGMAPGTMPLPWGLLNDQRAQVIATVDYMKAELPDVFFIQDFNPSGNSYPVNFAGRAFPLGSAGSPLNFILPIGNMVPPGFTPPEHAPPFTAAEIDPDGDGNPNVGPGSFVGILGTNQRNFGGVPNSGIFGASYTARAALHKMIGYTPQGTDAADNDGDGLVDEFDEGVSVTPGGPADPDAVQAVTRFITNHKHVTARSEMLYALLVNGQGPFGSVFSADDFSDREVQDTDNDGLPEFVDAWGKPLQFYRWPIFHHTDSVQKGGLVYNSAIEPREQFPLDTNNQLVAPAWWDASAGSAGGTNISMSALAFQNYFSYLMDPNWVSGTTPQPTAWDRTGVYARREYFCKFLILSAGADQEYGVNMLADSVIRNQPPDTTASLILIGNMAGSPPLPAENWAAWTTWTPGQNEDFMPPEAEDNIDNQNLQNQQGGIR